MYISGFHPGVKNPLPKPQFSGLDQDGQLALFNYQVSRLQNNIMGSPASIDVDFLIKAYHTSVATHFPMIPQDAADMVVDVLFSVALRAHQVLSSSPKLRKSETLKTMNAQLLSLLSVCDPEFTWSEQFAEGGLSRLAKEEYRRRHAAGYLLEVMQTADYDLTQLSPSLYAFILRQATD